MAITAKQSFDTTIKDGAEVLSSLKITGDTTITDFSRNKETIAPSATYTLDYMGIASPTFLQIWSSAEVDVTIWTQLFEKTIVLITKTDLGTPVITIENKDAVNPVVVDYIIYE